MIPHLRQIEKDIRVCDSRMMEASKKIPFF